LYLLLDEAKDINDFDSLFDLVWKIAWKKYFKKNYPIVIKATSIRSELSSTPTIQKICKKAIVNMLSNNSWEHIEEDESLERMEILILIIDNKVRVLLNTSWNALYMRWYRTNAWEAPIKESLAVALVLLSSWRFNENFYDPFCWSWTIAIEALMIAKNIAPWLKRAFAYEKLWLIQWEESENERILARTKTYNSNYSIIATDFDPEMIEIAKLNARNAWLENEINFSVKEFNEYLTEDIKWTLVSNPPYWERLKSDDLKWLYNSIDQVFRLNPELKWWIISSFMEFDTLIKMDNYKKRKLYNWGEKCYYWMRK
jgi:putative N6-adenine-specific DNA methylase